MSAISKIDATAKKLQNAHDQYFSVWKEEVFLNWRWWLGLLITILVLGLWLKFHKKSSRYRLLTAGFFVAAISISFDAIGVELGLWYYRFDVLPFISAYVPYDIALIPVVVMVLIQFKPNFSPFIKSIIFSLLTSFVGEGIFEWLNIYHPIHWRAIYSVPIYIFIYLFSHFLTTRAGFERVKP